MKNDLSEEMKNRIASAMEAMRDHVVAHCGKFDPEPGYGEMLRECFSFESVGGPFARMDPADVLRETDPVAYRCGMNDWADGLDLVWIGGTGFSREDVESAAAEFIEEYRETRACGMDEDHAAILEALESFAW